MMIFQFYRTKREG